MAGRVYKQWTSEEENALRSGVMRHGMGAWSAILSDADFKAALCAPNSLPASSRSNLEALIQQNA